MNRRTIAGGMAVIASVAITACAGVNHDAPNPTEDVQTQWVRIETPPSVVTDYITCFGNTLVIIDQADGNTTTDDNSPFCPITNVFNPAFQRKWHFRIVVRTNSDNAGTS